MNHSAEIFVALQRILPKHALSRLIAMAAESKRPWLKNWLINRAIDAFDIDMEEAITDDLEHYENFNGFFTRELKAGVRPIAKGKNSIVSPADGVISQAGPINKTRILQAKGIDYSVSRLVGSSDAAKRFDNGSFATIYLSPKDYHRVHMPAAGKLVRSRYIPGELFSVNDKTAQALPGLFARNERLVCEFESKELGDFVVIFVGAMLVAGIETVWGGFEKPGPGLVRETDHSKAALSYKKGEEIGRFKFGSTVILLFKEQAVAWQDNIKAAAAVNMGEKIAIGKV
ncbi:archaetidylserine decarboxylase [Porticoccaceae bacterium]|jgi:phosphatidylserine decarboxylase|nr:archaetidylserine decarboxylase [Porticoccaceae bacterium]MDC0134020.1 archaetidylserine decarboxylase [Porticoccaceae bacterium]MDC1476678.1 archaetidylserine decarboxylase [Porticoccaceae bacterium]CAI8317429.1 MAG: Phosphatidylserine decarboxylase proenzyme [SAR92 bacterium MED-G29]|tara:strand:- start:4226 stop:5083 length:858 start_codon:yes stop_codon:yes gene_type:complete